MTKYLSLQGTIFNGEDLYFNIMPNLRDVLLQLGYYFEIYEQDINEIDLLYQVDNYAYLLDNKTKTIYCYDVTQNNLDNELYRQFIEQERALEIQFEQDKTTFKWVE